MVRSNVILLAGFVMLGICSILVVALIPENLYSAENLLFTLAVAAIIIIGWFIVRGKPAQVRELFDFQARNLIIDLPYDDTFDLCMRSLLEFRHTITVNSDRCSGVIEANQKSFMDDFTNWSVIIRFSITEVARDKTRVSVTTDIRSPGFFNPGQHLQITKKSTPFYSGNPGNIHPGSRDPGIPDSESRIFWRESGEWSDPRGFPGLTFFPRRRQFFLPIRSCRTESLLVTGCHFGSFSHFTVTAGYGSDLFRCGFRRLIRIRYDGMSPK